MIPDFSKKTIETLAKRAAYKCSNPDCLIQTVGSNSDDNKSTSIGEAAHIKGARPGSKRYDPSMTDSTRAEITNGIWLCGNCHKLIDTDEQVYSSSILFKWREQHEKHTQSELGTAIDKITVGTITNSVGIAIGHGASATVNQNIFVGEFVRLTEVYIDPTSVFERVNIHEFVGRKGLFQDIQQFISTVLSGYFIIEANAGLGKTSILAKLVHQYGYINHFCDRSNNSSDEKVALKNLTAQIIARYQLNELINEAFLPSSAGQSHYFEKVLRQAASELDHDDKIVLIVDALDEAVQGKTKNPLGLPTTLPDGVIIIVSHRPTIRVTTEGRTERSVFHLEAYSEENQNDITEYLNMMACRPDFTKILADANCPLWEFVNKLRSKSAGVWIYLYYVLSEIEQGIRLPLDLDTLPNGIAQYYISYWQGWKKDKGDEWFTELLPLLATVAASREPISANMLKKWAGISQPTLWIDNQIGQIWRPFFAVQMVDSERFYNFYHATLQEFFEHETIPHDISEVENAFYYEIQQAVRDAHEKIVQLYLGNWQDVATSSLYSFFKQDNLYGLRHLVAHLRCLKRYKDVYQLLTAEDVDGKNVWFTLKEATDLVSSYISDISKAQLSAFEDQTLSQSEQIGQLVYYALMHSSIVEQSNTLPSVLIAALVQFEMWAPEKALLYIERMTKPAKFASAIGWLAPLLNESQLEWVMQITLHMRERRVAGEYTFEHFAAVLEYLQPFLSEEQKGRAYHYLFAYSEGIISSIHGRALFATADNNEEELWELFKELLYIYEDHEVDSTDEWEIDNGFYYWRRCLNAIFQNASYQTINKARATIRIRCTIQAKGHALRVFIPLIAKLGKPQHAEKLARRYFKGNGLFNLLETLSHFYTPHKALELLKERMAVAEETSWQQKRHLTEFELLALVRDLRFEEAFDFAQENYENSKNLYKMFVWNLPTHLLQHYSDKLCQNIPKSDLVILTIRLLDTENFEQARAVWKIAEPHLDEDDLRKYVNTPYFIWFCQFSRQQLVTDTVYLASILPGETYDRHGSRTLHDYQLPLTHAMVENAYRKTHSLFDTSKQVAMLISMIEGLSEANIRKAFALLGETKIGKLWQPKSAEEILKYLPNDLRSLVESETIRPRRNGHTPITPSRIKPPFSESDLLQALKNLNQVNAEEDVLLLVSVCSVATLEQLEIIATKAALIEEEMDEAYVIGHLAVRYILLGQPQEGLKLIVRIADNNIIFIDPTDHPVISALEIMLPHLHGQTLLTAIFIACRLHNDDPRCSALSMLITKLMSEDDEIAMSLFQSPLIHLSTVSRDELIDALSEFAPIIVRFGAADNVAKAIFDVSRWWP